MINYKKVLVLAVGGGNDSVSTILIQEQLRKKFNFKPKSTDIVAVLPDCLNYEGLVETNIKDLNIITDQSNRFVGKKLIKAFPEKVLSKYKSSFKELNIDNIYGISMINGSIGIYNVLSKLLIEKEYDLILAIDVGGDFISHKENVEVLSPMMDGYMLYALKSLKSFIKEKNLNTKVLFSIFGLGTDGESTPKMLKKAMSLIPDIKDYSFNENDIKDFISFYREIVEKNRYSRTTDYTILEILNKKHDNPSKFRGRFHTIVSENEKKVYYANFMHEQSEEFYGKYYLFENIDHIENTYSKKCNNGIEWFLNVQNKKDKINHELNGQSYNDIGNILKYDSLKNISLFFGTPSRKFNQSDQINILKDINISIKNNFYDMAIIYNENLDFIDKSLNLLKINDDLLLIGKNKEIMNLFIKKIEKLK